MRKKEARNQSLSESERKRSRSLRPFQADPTSSVPQKANPNLRPPPRFLITQKAENCLLSGTGIPGTGEENLSFADDQCLLDELLSEQDLLPASSLEALEQNMHWTRGKEVLNSRQRACIARLQKRQLRLNMNRSNIKLRSINRIGRNHYASSIQQLAPKLAQSDEFFSLKENLRKNINTGVPYSWPMRLLEEEKLSSSPDHFDEKTVSRVRAIYTLPDSDDESIEYHDATLFDDEPSMLKKLMQSYQEQHAPATKELGNIVLKV